jgi:hypothetical protein
VSSDPTSGKVNEGLAAVGRSSGIHATFGGQRNAWRKIETDQHSAELGAQ